MSCFVTFVVFYERVVLNATARVCGSAPTGSVRVRDWWARTGPPGGPGHRTVRLAYTNPPEFSARVPEEQHSSAPAPAFLHIAASSRLRAHGRTVSRPQEWDERPTNKIPVLKVFGLRITSLRKYSVRWTCPNLSMSKADTVSQVFTTQK